MGKAVTWVEKRLKPTRLIPPQAFALPVRGVPRAMNGILRTQISPIRIQAANRPGSFSSRSGTSILHFSTAKGQRG
jgi:hypothetical protein